MRELRARAGLGNGARLDDIGCGPIGALVELADIAGSSGAVVGVDSSAEAVETARAIVTRQNLGTVRMIHADIHTLDAAALTSRCERWAA